MREEEPFYLLPFVLLAAVAACVVLVCEGFRGVDCDGEDDPAVD